MTERLAELLQAAFPGDELAVEDRTGSGDHFQVTVASARFEGLSLVDATCRIILVHRPQWWVIENPVGRLNRWLGEPVMYFDPADYGDPYTKRTALWGRFNAPFKTPVPATEGSRMHRLPPSADRANLRSETPPGFARAFFEANQ